MFLFLLFLLPFVYSGNFVFNETFGKSKFTIEKTNGWNEIPPCYIFGKENNNGGEFKKFTLSRLIDDRYNVTINNKVYYCFMPNKTISGCSQWGDGINFNNYSTTTKMYTSASLNYTTTLGGTGCSVSISGLYYPFGYTINLSFNDDSILNLSAVLTSGSAASGGIGFVDKDGYTTGYFELESTICGQNDINVTSGCILVDTEDRLSTSKKKISITGEQMLNYTENVTTLYNIVGLYLVHGQTIPVIFDDIYLKFTNGTNQLPSFNVSLNYTCANSTEDITRVNYEFETYDAEGDTLYYFEKEVSIYEENKTTYFYSDVCADSYLLGPILSALFCYKEKDYNFLDNTIFLADTCEINTDTYNVSQFNLKFSESDTGDIWGLELQSSCVENDKSFYYDLGLPSKNVNFVTEIRNMENGDNFNISLLDDSFNEIISVNVNVSNNRLLIRDNGYIKINITKQESSLFEFYDIDTRENTAVFKVWNSYTYPAVTGTYYTANINLSSYNNSIEFSKIGLNAGNILVMGLQTRGVTTSLNFSTTQPTHSDILGYGKKSIVFYVSDSVHQPDEFTIKEISFKVDNCRYYTDGFANTEDYDSALDDGDLIGFLNGFLGIPFRNYMNTADTNGFGQKIIWWIYIFLFIGIFVWNFMMSKVPDVIMPLLISSVAILFVSILGGYTPSLAVSGIGLGLVFMAMFTNVFKGGTNG
jgi:hypothetical protein